MGGGGVSKCITAHYYKVGWKDIISDILTATAILEIEMEEIKMITPNKFKGLRYSENEISQTITTCTGSGNSQDQFVKEMVIGSMQTNAMRKDNIKYKIMPNGNIRAYNGSTLDKRGISEWQITNPENESPTITTSHNPKIFIKYRIRKLTPRECFRLQGMDDADIDKIDAYRIKTTLKDGTVREKPIPKTQKYKMAGNSIVVDVLYHIFYQMFIAEPPKPQPKQLSLFDL